MMSGDGAVRRRNILMAGGLTAAGALAAAPAALAADFTVTSSDDSGDGTLRDALNDADATPGADRILFSSAVTGDTITLQSPLPEIDSPVEIIGPGADSLTISGNDAHRIFYVFHPDLSGEVKIEGLTLTEGRAGVGGGSAIYAFTAFLELSEMRITDNHASENNMRGGAVNAFGSTVTLENSIVSGNSADGGNSYGGGIAADFGSLNVVGSTLSGNSASGSAGSGGAIWHGFGSLTITRSTISGNSAGDVGGGVMLSYAELQANGATMTDNASAKGGGLFFLEDPANLDVADPVLRNTIVAGNSATGSGPDLARYNASDPFQLAYTLVGSTPDPGDFNENVPGSNLLDADPKLGPLANNGGPTRTHALLGGSPAINRGSTGGAAACTGADQRGVPRQGRCDIGAYELARCAGTLVNRVGTNGRDVIGGTSGRDGFLAKAGNDRLFGFAGNDAFCAGPGADRAFGGPGADRALGQGGPDRLFGGPGVDRLLGQRGFDRLFGGAQRDFLFGGGQADRLFGQRGSDRLFGGPGRDLLVGGSQRDLLRPGPGRDRTRQ